MQTDEEVGKVAQAVPIMISRTLELFVHSLLTKTMEITNAKNAKTLSPSHMKQCILSENRFDFLKDLVKSIPDVSGADDEVPTPPLTPAPMGMNLVVGSGVTITRVQPEIRVPKDAAISRMPSHVISNPKDCVEAISINADRIKQNDSPPPSNRVPNFEISMPSSFYGGQPNFYTELNPLNLSTHQSNTAVSDKQESSNFNYNSHLDEDYDT
ncbi:hypothetical protein PV328_006838 [Microctonus aethiopoides]|uniref:Transcription factor CBF/NF-Y/archaeal histone domain-containing protein n=1 Tax=Microctonus aethiopoides TaxID=144406 RepID=A0AA39KTZ1_9HYME|nr:hypothetical protein PV328_006838 [Microctonus aethiopoides]